MQDCSSKLSLLQDYCETLEKENYAKNSEIQLLYSQNRSILDENHMLKSCIDSMRHEWDSERTRYNSLLHHRQAEAMANSRGYCQQLMQSVDYGSLRAVAEEMRHELDDKERELYLLQK